MLNKKTMLGVAAVSLSTLIAANAIAAQPGVYVGGQLGVGNVHQSGVSASDLDLPKGLTFQSFNSSTSKANAIAGRLFTGYQFNSNFAAELGWTKFSNVDSKFSGRITQASLAPIGKPAGLRPLQVPNNLQQGKTTVKTDAIDLVAKGILPVSDKVSVYGKAGAAYVLARGNASATVRSGKKAVVVKGSDSEHKLMPTFGAGVSYDFNPNLSADLSYNRIQKVGGSSNINSTDLVSVGLIYSIG